MTRIFSSDWNVDDDISAERLQDFNQEFDDLFSLGTDRGRIRLAISGTPLKIDVGAFAWRVGSTSGQFAGDTDIDVADDDTNYVEIDAANDIQINQSGWTTSHGRLGTVTCVGGDITAISIWKPDVVGGSLGGSSLVNIETLSTDRTLISTDKTYQALNADGVSRIVTLDTTNQSEGATFLIKNTVAKGTGGALALKQSTTLLWVISPGAVARAVFDGTDWNIFGYDPAKDYCGDGSDGNYLLDGVQAAVGGLFSKSTNDYTLLRDAHFLDLRIATGCTLNTNGYRFGCYILDLQGSGDQLISNGPAGGNGVAGSGQTGGGTGGTAGAAAHGAGSAPATKAGTGGGTGGNGANSGGPNTAGTNGGGGSSASPAADTNAIGADGPAASTGGGGGSANGNPTTGGAGGSAQTATGRAVVAMMAAISWQFKLLDLWTNNLNGISGGGGGGGGGSAWRPNPGAATGGKGGGGGASGSEGGRMAFNAYTMMGTGNIAAKGGTGGNGGAGAAATGSGSNNAGGGGGGAAGNGGPGGEIRYGYADKSGWSGAASAAGGSAGSVGSGGAQYGSGSAGSAGSAGTAGPNGIVVSEQFPFL